MVYGGHFNATDVRFHDGDHVFDTIILCVMIGKNKFSKKSTLLFLKCDVSLTFGARLG